MSSVKRYLKEKRPLVWDALNIPCLEMRCIDKEESFHPLGQVSQTKDGPSVFIDRGSKVLAVAHLDVVIDSDIFAHVAPTRGKDKGYEYVYSPALDDRLGAYILLDLLPILGVNVDVLLTTGEESGRSTAAYFETVKDYHWMFQFDRHGTDVVMYDYESKSNQNRLGRIGFELGTGSFSDICYLEHLKVCGFNFGTGYHDEHNVNCYANLNETVDQVARFCLFYEQYANKRIPFAYEKESVRRKSSHWGNWGQWNRAYVKDWDEMDKAFEQAVAQDARSDLDTPASPTSALSRTDGWVKMNLTASGWVRVEGKGIYGETTAFQMKPSTVRPYLTIGEYQDLMNKGSLYVKLILDDLIDAAAAESQGRYR